MSLVAAVVNSLEAVIVFGDRAAAPPLGADGLARRGARSRCCRSSLVRLSLAYFPALVGHAVDAVVLLVSARAPARSSIARASSLVFAALHRRSRSSPTRSRVLNFAVLVPLFLLVRVDRDAIAGGRVVGQLGLVPPAALGGVLVAGPLLRPLRADRSSTCARACRWRRSRSSSRSRSGSAATRATAVEAPSDAGRSLRGPGHRPPARHARRPRWRLYVFYGFFAFAVVRGRRASLCRALEGTDGAASSVGVGLDLRRSSTCVRRAARPQPRPIQQGPRDRRAACSASRWRRSARGSGSGRACSRCALRRPRSCRSGSPRAGWLPDQRVRPRALDVSRLGSWLISSSMIACSARTTSSRGTSALRNWSARLKVFSFGWYWKTKSAGRPRPAALAPASARRARLLPRRRSLAAAAARPAATIFSGVDCRTICRSNDLDVNVGQPTQLPDVVGHRGQRQDLGDRACGSCPASAAIVLVRVADSVSARTLQPVGFFERGEVLALEVLDRARSPSSRRRRSRARRTASRRGRLPSPRDSDARRR